MELRENAVNLHCSYLVAKDRLTQEKAWVTRHLSDEGIGRIYVESFFGKRQMLLCIKKGRHGKWETVHTLDEWSEE